MRTNRIWKNEISNLSLLDKDFLIELLTQKHRELYGRVTALDIDENPKEFIEGKITTGSINIDGSSSVRRTCSLTLVSEDIDINNYYWGLKTKFKLEIGLKNNLTNQYKYTVEGKYPDIVWFKQGIFYLSTFNTSYSTKSYTISVQGKDKMCMLNGDFGGQLFASVDFGKEEYKEKIVVPVNIEVFSSTALEVNKYYMELKDNDNIAKIHQDNPLYIFSKDVKGNYYKQGNFYSLISGRGDLNNLPIYKIYKLITKPEEFFTKVNFSSNAEAENIILFRKEKDVYVRDYSVNVLNQDFYVLKSLYEKDEILTTKYLPMEKILRESIHTYAGEPYQNIIINNLDEFGLEQLTYRGDTPLYALRCIGSDTFEQLVYLEQSDQLKEIVEDPYFILDNLSTEIASGGATRIIKKRSNENTPYHWEVLSPEYYQIVSEKLQYTVVKISYGDDVGYRAIDLVYPGELISKEGETLTTAVLDKIKNVLGDFEYFYDEEGHFIFQKKKAYVDTYWSQLMPIERDSYVNYANSNESDFAFNFEGNNLISAFNNTPNLKDLKNDFVVWGKRKGVSGADIPIHARYAIDKKPKEYLAFDGILYCVDKNNIIHNQSEYIKIREVDWRELIYQMALDYFAGQGCSSKEPIYDLNGNFVLNQPDLFLYTIGERNNYYYPTGKTGYEQYYTDMQGFWRMLYNPNYFPVEIYEKGAYKKIIVKDQETQYFNREDVWRDGGFSELDIEFYVSTLLEDDPTGKILEQYNSLKNSNIEKKKAYLKYYITKDTAKDIVSRKYWARAVFEAPETLNFWLDFLDDENELAYFSIPMLGDRIKVVNEDKVDAVYYKDVPDFLLNGTSTTDFNESVIDSGKITGYNHINIPSDLADLFTVSYRGFSAKEKIDNLLYKHAYCAESAAITTIPNYSLQPNTRIYIQDENSKINGEYIINKITLSLTYNGTMSINAIKAPVRLY